MPVYCAEHIKLALLPVFEKYRDKVSFAYLFGSSVSNEVMPSSDIDIAVFLSISDPGLRFDFKLDLYADFCRALKRNDIDVVVLNSATNIILLDNIVRHGMVIFDGNPENRAVFKLDIIHSALDFKDQRSAVMGI